MALTVTQSVLDYMSERNIVLYRKKDGFSTFNPMVLNEKSAIYDVLRLVPNEGTNIISAKVRISGGFDKNFTRSTQNSRWWEFTDVSNTLSYFTIEVESSAKTWALTQDMIDQVTTGKGQLFVNDVLAVPVSIKDNDIFKIIPLEGYKFVENGVKLELNAVNPYRNFTINDELNIATYTANPTLTDATLVRFLVETVLLPPENVRGFNNIYQIDKDQLKEVTKQRFQVMGGSVENPEKKDLGVNILGLIELPLTLDPSLVVGKQNVYLGDYQTSVNADFLATDILNLDLGVISVPRVNDSFLDYINTTALVHLPYSNPINIDVNYVIGEEIGVKYAINLYDGLATITISSSKLNDVIATANVDMNIKIPFGNLDTAPSGNSPNDIKLGGFNGLLVPYIEIVRNDVINSSKLFTIPVTDETILNTATGFIQVEQIDLKCKASSSEKDMIINVLKQGVIIK